MTVCVQGHKNVDSMNGISASVSVLPIRTSALARLHVTGHVLGLFPKVPQALKTPRLRISRSDDSGAKNVVLVSA